MVKKKKVKLPKRRLKRDNYIKQGFTHPPNPIYRNFKIAVKDLRKVKSYFWFSFILFFFTGLIGYIFPVFFEEQIMKIIKDLISKTEGLSVLELIQFIMANNIQSAFVGMLFGILLGIIPFSIIIVNGYILGFVANKIVALEGILVLWRLLPHGVFEIPAILISVGLGLRLGVLLMYNCIKSNWKRVDNLSAGLLMFLSILFFPIAFLIYIVITFLNVRLRQEFFRNFWDSLRIFVFIVVPLLVIAGIIEGVLIEILG